MKNTDAKNQLHLVNAELGRRVTLMEARSLEKTRAVKALQDSEKRYRRLFESAKDGILILDAETGKVVDVNPFLLDLLGYSLEAFSGKYLWEIGAFKDIAASKDAFETLQVNEYIRYDDLPLETRDGRPIEVEFVSNVYLVDHRKVIQCNIRDITARKQGEAERKRLLAAIEQSAEAVFMTDARGTIQFVNPAFERMTGYARDEAIGQKSRIFKNGEQDDLFYRTLWETISGGSTWAGRMVNQRKDGTLYTEEATISPVRDPSGRIVNYVGVKRDITDHLQLAAQFQQAQKMEAVGLLAGGVAHDFNNMLGVILGYAEMALERIAPTHPVHADIEEIIKAANRSTVITRQLLAFARKQTIAPVMLDLNRTITSILKILQRLIGEDIDLAWLPGNQLWAVKMDPGQVDQILANLCANARDAIADVGKITIQTGNVVLDETYVSHHAGFVTGEYVLLTVSDDGCGIQKDILDRVFEPFFTSKQMGQGTGLGLSTVYGIVKQNNGFINVYSEPEKGTTFKIYLPRDADQAVDSPPQMKARIPLGSGETVLVVEDEYAIMQICKMMLEQSGYRVLTAAGSGEALELAESHADEIRLLLSDVVMPEMNGRKLAKRLRSLCPGIKTLFMSGYTAHVIANRGVLDEGVNFIKKPFSKRDLAIKVHEALIR